MMIRVVLAGQAAVCTFDVRLTGVPAYTKHLVIISFRHGIHSAT
jgi:hypothetical protein